MSTNTAMAETVVGTPFYMSPELFEEKPYRCAASRIRIMDDYINLVILINRRDVRMFLRMEHSSNQNGFFVPQHEDGRLGAGLRPLRNVHL
eukprot:COSAG04_NODE_3198_length_3061_cov_25.008778_3_plen_91_part_00